MSYRQLGTKVHPEFLSTMEQKLVQRSETAIVADACNASYMPYMDVALAFLCRSLATSSWPSPK